MTTANATASATPKPKQHVIRTLGKSLREYKKVSLLSPAFVAVESVLEILIPTVMASLIDGGISGGSMPAILKFGLILLGSFADIRLFGWKVLGYRRCRIREESASRSV